MNMRICLFLCDHNYIIQACGILYLPYEIIFDEFIDFGFYFRS